MDSPSLYIAIAGLISTSLIGFAGLFFTQRARTQTYRDLLYNRQLDLYTELLTSATGIHFAVGQLVMAGDKADYERSWRAFHQAATEAGALAPKVMALLPEDTYSAWMGLHAAMSACLHHALTRRLTEDDLAPIESHLSKLLLVSRAHLGIEALSKESVGLFGGGHLKEARAVSVEQIATALASGVIKLK